MSTKAKQATPTDDAEPAKPSARQPAKPKITDSIIARMSVPDRRRGDPPAVSPLDWFAPAVPPPGVLPPNTKLAMDEDIRAPITWAAANMSMMSMDFMGMTSWLGYPTLAQLSTQTEYRRAAEILAMHATKKWIKLQSTGDDDKSDKIAAIEGAMKRLNVKDVFHRLSIQDSFFGRAHLFIDCCDVNDRSELRTSIGDGTHAISAQKMAGDKLKRIGTVEAVWCYPTQYDSNDPLQDDWYLPTSWYVQGKEVHGSRLLRFVAREVPDILKPAYAFGGLSLTQMMKPYVDSWVRDWHSVSDLIHAFSVMGIKTELAESLASDGDQLFKRLKLFNATRDNKGLMMLQKGAAGEAEEFFNVSVPLGTLDALLAQAEERLCLAGGFPVIVLLGLTPHGLNASADGEIQIFEQAIGAYQEQFFRPHLTTILRLIQLSEFGEVDPEITFAFEPLRALTALELSTKRKTDADTDAVLVQSGIIDPLEVRERLAAEPDSPYANLDVTDVPEQPEGAEDPPDGGEPPEQDATPSPDLDTPAGQLATSMPREAREAAVGERGEREASMRRPDRRDDRGRTEGRPLPFAGGKDAFNEADHPRGQSENAGQFGPGGGGSKESPSAPRAPRAALKETKIVDGKRVQANGSPLPAHIEKLKLPPAWADVRYSDDPKADLMAVGKDSKDRVQSVYSEAFSANNAAAKFARIEELRGKFGYISKQNEDAQRSSNPKTKDSADCLSLIMKMGVRPGSDDDTGAKVKAYGATTLEGRHVVETPAGVSLRFVGKKGVSLDLPVEDAGLAAMLMQRAKASGASGKLFPATNDKALLDHTHSLDGGGFKTKDFRTHVGTASAYELVQQKPKPATMAEYKKAVMDVAKAVSHKLGNTPIIALQSYISPVVFSSWREAIAA